MRMTNHRALNLVGARGRESNVLDDALIGGRANPWTKGLIVRIPSLDFDDHHAGASQPACDYSRGQSEF